MNYGTSSGGRGGLYFTIGSTHDDKGRKKACFGLRCAKDTPNAKQVFKQDGTPALDKKGAEVWRLENDFINERIIDLVDETSEYGRRLVVLFNGGQLALPHGERYWTDFLLRLPNVDLSKPVRLKPHMSLDEEKSKPGKERYDYYMTMRQGGSAPDGSDGDKIERAFTQANNYGRNEDGTGGLPAGEQVEDPKTGNLVWSFLKRNKALEGIVAQTKEKLKVINASTPQEAFADYHDPDAGQEDGDDVAPF